MQPPLNASEAWQTILAGYFEKGDPSKKHTKSQLSLVTKVDESKVSSLVKQLHREIPKFKT